MLSKKRYKKITGQEYQEPKSGLEEQVNAQTEKTMPSVEN